MRPAPSALRVTSADPVLGARSRRASLRIWSGLFAAAAVAWAVTIRRAADMGAGIGTMGLGLAGFLLLWVVMMAAMMLPSVAPTASLYVRTIGTGSRESARALRLAGLVCGYLAAWAAFGVVAFAVAWGAGRLAEAHPRGAAWVGASLLALAGVYQLTPFKDVCLRHCRSPLGFLVRFGSYRGRLKDARVGLYHGLYCVGCCWGLMVVLITVGVMNLAWMAGLATVVLLEKTWRHGKGFGVAFGAALIALALFVPSHPWLVAGIHAGGAAAAGM